MSDRKFMDLGRRERQILEVLFRRGSATARDVHTGLPDPPSYSAVRAMLAKLEAKGLVASEPDGVRRIYRAIQSATTARRTALRRVVDGLFEGSVERTMAALLSARPPDADELERISQMIERARKTGR